ncbi:MAG: phage holin family protein [Eubacterium sp.]|jgi:hypothetical protein|nr:phage holin family protein [Eubacterium sp.]
MEFIRPELLILIPILNVLGVGIKGAKFFSDERIPIVLGACGIFLATSYMFAFVTEYTWLKGIFTGIVQGVLVTGVSVYGHQIFKQTGKSNKKSNIDEN